MYSREKRMKAIELYIKYGKSTADVIRVLGYPDRNTYRKDHETSCSVNYVGLNPLRFFQACCYKQNDSES